MLAHDEFASWKQGAFNSPRPTTDERQAYQRKRTFEASNHVKLGDMLYIRCVHGGKLSNSSIARLSVQKLFT